MEKRLDELKGWLKECDYPEEVINRSFHNAKLQGPANQKINSKNIPFVTTYHENVDNKSLVKNIRKKMGDIHSIELKEIFDDSHVILAQKQPKNILRSLTNASFVSTDNEDVVNRPAGTYKCTDSRCKICRLYLKEVNCFQLSNGMMWEIKRHITCRSLNVIYCCVYCKYSE